MAPAHDPVFEKALLDLTALSIGLAPDRLVSTDLLGELDISVNDLLALVAALEDHCQVVLPDCELARCETLGDLVDRLRVLALDARYDRPSDAGRHDHGQRHPENDPRDRAPEWCSARLRPRHAEQRQAS